MATPQWLRSPKISFIYDTLKNRIYGAFNYHPSSPCAAVIIRRFNSVAGDNNQTDTTWADDEYYFLQRFKKGSIIVLDLLTDLFNDKSAAALQKSVWDFVAIVNYERIKEIPQYARLVWTYLIWDQTTQKIRSQIIQQSKTPFTLIKTTESIISILSPPANSRSASFKFNEPTKQQVIEHMEWKYPDDDGKFTANPLRSAETDRVQIQGSPANPYYGVAQLGIKAWPQQEQTISAVHGGLLHVSTSLELYHDRDDIQEEQKTTFKESLSNCDRVLTNELNTYLTNTVRVEQLTNTDIKITDYDEATLPYFLVAVKSKETGQKQWARILSIPDIIGKTNQQPLSIEIKTRWRDHENADVPREMRHAAMQSVLQAWSASQTTETLLPAVLNVEIPYEKKISFLNITYTKNVDHSVERVQKYIRSFSLNDNVETTDLAYCDGTLIYDCGILNRGDVDIDYSKYSKKGGGLIWDGDEVVNMTKSRFVKHTVESLHVIQYNPPNSQKKINGQKFIKSFVLVSLFRGFAIRLGLKYNTRLNKQHITPANMTKVNTMFTEHDDNPNTAQLNPALGLNDLITKIDSSKAGLSNLVEGLTERKWDRYDQKD